MRILRFSTLFSRRYQENANVYGKLKKGILMNQPSKGFHPITRAFAYVGAFICAFFSLTIFISSVFAFTDIFNLLADFGMTVLTSMLAWAFWYAGKAGKNPFIVRPFSSPK